MKHLTKNEILAKMKEVQETKNNSFTSPFTGIATLCNYILWKEEAWSQDQLAEYNNKVHDYDEWLDSEELSLGELSDRIYEKADFRLEKNISSIESIRVSKKKKWQYEMAKQILEANNKSNELSTRYVIIHFNVLIDMGYGKTELEKNQQSLCSYLFLLNNGDGSGIMGFRQELIDEAGIYIEMPDNG